MVGIVALTSLASAGAMAADQTFLASSICQPASEYGNVFFAYGAAFAAYEYDDGAIVCGVGQDNADDTNDDLYVYYDDNNGNSGAGVNFQCDAYSVKRDYTTIVFEGTLYGCGTAGGCGSDPGVFASSGYVQFVDVWHGSDYSVALNCTIPYPVSGNYSALYSVKLDEN